MFARLGRRHAFSLLALYIGIPPFGALRIKELRSVSTCARETGAIPRQPGSCAGSFVYDPQAGSGPGSDKGLHRCKPLVGLVAVAGFEPATPTGSPRRREPRLKSGWLTKPDSTRTQRNDSQPLARELGRLSPGLAMAKALSHPAMWLPGHLFRGISDYRRDSIPMTAGLDSHMWTKPRVRDTFCTSWKP